MTVEINATLLYAAIAFLVSAFTGVCVFIWKAFEYQQQRYIDPLHKLGSDVTSIIQDFKELKTALTAMQHDFHKRFTLKDGTPIEQVIERMSEQFELMVDRDLLNFYLDSQAKYECDANGYCTRINERYSEITGVSEHRAMGNGWIDVIHPNDRTRVFNAWEDFIQKDIPFDATYRVVSNEHPDGLQVHGRAFSKREEKDIKLIIGTIEPY